MTYHTPFGKTLINKGGKFYLTAHYFIHNLVTNVLILPSLPLFDFLPPAIADGSVYTKLPYWKNIYTGWLENLPLINIVGLGLNLLILSIGIGDSFRKWKLAGWVPLGILLAYHFSTALVHNSGGRHLVPVDWIIFIYFGLGLLQIANWLTTLLINPRFSDIFNKAFCPHEPNPLNEENLPAKVQGAADKKMRLSIQTGIFLTLPFFLYVLAMTVLDQTTPQRYTYLNKNEVFEQLLQEDIFAYNGMDARALEKFLEDPQARAIYGMNLYPRFFWQNHGLDRGAYLAQPYPRLGSMMLGALGTEQVVLSLLNSPKKFPHGENVIVIGCYTIGHSQYGDFGYIDALLVADIGNEPAIYVRSPAEPLAFKCPLPEPE